MLCAGGKWRLPVRLARSGLVHSVKPMGKVIRNRGSVFAL
jgi:hypothetical protein